MDAINKLHLHPEDLGDLLAKLERSLEIKFAKDELAYVQTFGELCDHVKQKVKGVQTDDCTSQQAFYKLKDAMINTLRIQKSVITPKALLVDLFPRPQRRTKIRSIERKLGFKLSLLRPPLLVIGILSLLLLASLILLVWNWQLGLALLVFSTIGFWLASKTGKEFELATLGEVAEKMTREHYALSRRDSRTYNEREIEKVLVDLFQKDLYIDKSSLTRETRLLD